VARVRETEETQGIEGGQGELHEGEPWGEVDHLFIDGGVSPKTFLAKKCLRGKLDAETL